ncbi:MAG: hypothetical protein M1814_004190 [Vezdaea aestivalis]|nr:MAG: hypothetical protein M1814_004190 [Vezdaea aestivalis]
MPSLLSSIPPSPSSMPSIALISSDSTTRPSSLSQGTSIAPITLSFSTTSDSPVPKSATPAQLPENDPNYYQSSTPAHNIEPLVLVSFITVTTSIYITNQSPGSTSNTGSPVSQTTSPSPPSVPNTNLPLIVLAIFASLLLLGLILCFWLYLRLARPAPTYPYQPLPTTIHVSTNPSAPDPNHYPAPETTDVVFELPPAYGMLHSDSAVQPTGNRGSTHSWRRRSIATNAANPPLESSMRSFPLPTDEEGNGLWEMGIPSERATSEQVGGGSPALGPGRRRSRTSWGGGPCRVGDDGGALGRRASYHLRVPSAANSRRGSDGWRARSEGGEPVGKS